MTRLTIAILGGLSIQLDGTDARSDLPTRKSKAILAYLALSPGMLRSREHLAATFWDRSAEEQARASLRQTLSSVRRTLSRTRALINTDSESVWLDTRAVEVDALQFARLTAERSAESLEKAVALYRGELLGGFSLREEGFEQWMSAERRRFHELAVQAFSELVGHYTRVDRFDRGIAIAERLLVLDPLLESAHRSLIRLYLRSGRREAAARQFQECARILSQELGIAPAEETQQLAAEINREPAVRGGADSTTAQLIAQRSSEPSAVALPSDKIDLSLHDKPSIAVLPFANVSADPEQDYFADGLVEDIITTLSKISGLVVIARNSSFTYKGRAIDVRQVARELGVRYVLEGGVRKSANRIRITAQLIEAGTGAHVWAERYDRAIEDIFAVQDEITLVLATEMQVRLTEGEQARLRYTTTNNIEAWNHWVQGLSHFRRGLSRAGLTQALKLWQQANALDPSSACLNAMLGFLHYANARFGFWDDRETALRKGGAYVDKALSLDPENSDAHMTRSLLLMLQRRFDDAVLAARKAIEYGPGSADNAVFASFVFDNAGLVQEAVVQIERAMKLSPIFPPNYLGQLGNAYRLAGRYDEAIAAYETYHKRSPGRGVTDLVIIYEQLGQPEKAKAWATQLLLAEPKFTVSSWTDTQFRKDTGRLEAEMAALRAAGLPD